MFKMVFEFVFASLAHAQSSPSAEAVSAATSAQQPPGWMQFVPFAVILVVFYFFLIRPQAKKQKETQQFLNSLKEGDQVISQSGILGRITGMNDHIVTLEIARDVQIKVLRTMVMAFQSSLQTKKEGK